MKCFKSFIIEDGKLFTGIGTGKRMYVEKNTTYTATDEGFYASLSKNDNLMYIVLGSELNNHTGKHKKDVDFVKRFFPYEKIITEKFNFLKIHKHSSWDWDKVLAICECDCTLAKPITNTECIRISSYTITGEPEIIDGMMVLKEFVRKYPSSLVTGETLSDDLYNMIMEY